MTRKARNHLRRLQTEAYLSFTHLHRKMDTLLGEFIIDEGLLHVTARQATVLVVLFNEARPMSARRIAEKLGISEVTAGRFVHALTEGGWVTRERDPNDARSILISLTEHARQNLPRFAAISNRLLDIAFQGFSEEEIESMHEALRRLASNIGHAELPTLGAGLEPES